MEYHKLIPETTEVATCLLFLTLTIAFATTATILDEQPVAAIVPPELNPGVTGASTGTGVTGSPDGHTLTFFMHDILGGSNPSARAVTGVVNNPAISGQVPFAKPNGAVLPVSKGIPQNNNNNNGLINNNNLPFLTGLGGTTQNVVQNNGINIPVSNGSPLTSGSTLQQLMFGTTTAIDDELTEGHELGSGFIGRAQGFYATSSVDGNSQTMAFTDMFEKGHYVDSLSFLGVHRTAVSESQLAIMGGNGKYVNAKGFAIVKTLPTAANIQHETDGVETTTECSVYVSY